MNSHHPCGLMAVHMKYPVKRFETLARIGGAGYQVLAKLDHYAVSTINVLLRCGTKRSSHSTYGWVEVAP